MKRASGVDGDSPDESKNSGYVKNPGERVNCDEVADAVLQRARYSMELRKFLDENKTNEQTYENLILSMSSRKARKHPESRSAHIVLPATKCTMIHHGVPW